MNETTYVYIVRSDLNDNSLGDFYAEFETADEAISYARRFKDKLTYVERAEVGLDEHGDVDTIFDAETIWVYTLEPDNDIEEESEDEIDFDKLVEELEEFEDVVECKECFDLFPKADAVRIEIGYVCPVCNCVADKEDFEVSESEAFSMDFPDVSKFEEDDFEADEESPEEEASVEDIVATLVEDEEEAIEGYEAAEEIIEAEEELENKEEILATLDHIKEEEIEHIEELEAIVSDADSPEILVEGNELYKYDCYVEGDYLGTVEAKNESEAFEKMMAHWPEYHYGIYDGYATVELAEEEYEEDEEVLDEETHAQLAKPEGDRVAAYNNALAYAKKYNKPYIYGYINHTGKFFALDQPIKITDLSTAEKEFKTKYKNCKGIHVAYPDKSFITESFKFTAEEQETYNIDEEGNSLDSYDTYVRCNWCGEPSIKIECVFEANLGYLCDRCQEEIRSHGGPLTIIEEPTEEEIKATLEEAVKMTKDELLDKHGTTDVELINAGRPEEERVELKED